MPIFNLRSRKVAPTPNKPIEPAFELPSDYHRFDGEEQLNTNVNAITRHQTLVVPGSKNSESKPAQRLRIKTPQKKLVQSTITLAEAEEFAKEQEELKKLNWIDVIKEYGSKADVFAAAHTVPKHRLCIIATAALMPVSLIIITWDLLAVEVFEIPHLSTINTPLFVLFINFIAMPVAMYGYMLEYLMHESSRMAITGLVCIIFHPILFFIRVFMEFWYDGYRNELLLYFEDTTVDGEPYDYPIDALKPETPFLASGS